MENAKIWSGQERRWNLPIGTIIVAATYWLDSFFIWCCVYRTEVKVNPIPLHRKLHYAKLKKVVAIDTESCEQNLFTWTKSACRASRGTTEESWETRTSRSRVSVWFRAELGPRSTGGNSTLKDIKVGNFLIHCKFFNTDIKSARYQIS